MRKSFFDTNEKYKKLRNKLSYEDAQLLIDIVSEAALQAINDSFNAIHNNNEDK